MMRTVLYEAAYVLRTRTQKCSWLKAWGMHTAIEEVPSKWRGIVRPAEPRGCQDSRPHWRRKRRARATMH